MSDHTTAAAPSSPDNNRGLRALALVAVVIGVLALAAAAFLLSYSGIHAIALAAGVSPRLARIYPLIFDALLVIACAAVLSLRGAGALARLYAWLSMLVLLATAATADALHAINAKLPHRPTEAAAAIIPWLLALIGFGLLLSMLRHARHRRTAGLHDGAVRPAGLAAGPQQQVGIHDLLGPPAPGQLAARSPAQFPAPPPAAQPSSVQHAPTPLAPVQQGPVQQGPVQQGSPAHPETPPATAAQQASPTRSQPVSQPQPPAQPTAQPPAPQDDAATPAGPAPAGLTGGHEPDLAVDAEAGQDDPTSDEGRRDDGHPAASWVPTARDERIARGEEADRPHWVSGLSPAPVPASTAQTGRDALLGHDADLAVADPDEADAHAASTDDDGITSTDSDGPDSDGPDSDGPGTAEANTDAASTAGADAHATETGAAHAEGMPAGSADAEPGESAGGPGASQGTVKSEPARSDPAGLPQFRRLRSSPTPPED